MDSGTLKLKPLNVFIGKNSSGKSTILRTFPLMKQTFERQIKDPILWYGDYVDLGSFRNSINTKCNPESDTISFTFGVSLPQSTFIFYKDADKTIDAEVSMEISEERIASYSIKISKNEITLKSEPTGNRFIAYLNNKLLENISFPISNSLYQLLSFDYDDESSTTFSDVNYYYHRRIDDSFDSTTECINALFSDDLRKKKVKRLMRIFNKDKDKSPYSDERSIEKAIIISSIRELVNLSYEVIKSESNNVQYFQPVRTRGDRFYRVQGVRVDEVDSDGNNGPMVLYSMSQHTRDSFEKWCFENLGFAYMVSNVGGNSESASVLVRTESGEEHNMTDVGFGYSQIFPIVLSIWQASLKKEEIGTTIRIPRSKTKTIVIEQPELHLHPAFQQKIMKILVKLIKLAEKKDCIMIIIETHSEAVINYLGRLLYKKEIDENDLNIYVCDKINNETQIKKINFNKQGYMENWPIGFFGDEE